MTSLRMTIAILTLLLVSNVAAFANVRVRNTEEQLLEEVLQNAKEENRIFEFLHEKEVFVYDYEGNLIVSGTEGSELSLPADATVLVDNENEIIYITD